MYFFVMFTNENRTELLQLKFMLYLDIFQALNFNINYFIIKLFYFINFKLSIYQFLIIFSNKQLRYFHKK